MYVIVLSTIEWNLCAILEKQVRSRATILHDQKCTRRNLLNYDLFHSPRGVPCYTY